MKRRKPGRLCILGMAVFLCGCQPTTDVAIVTPKSAIAGAKMVDENVAGDVLQQVEAPKTCDLELTDEQSQSRIVVHADVTVPEVDGIRLKKTETRAFHQKDMDNLQKNLLEGNSVWRRVYTQEQREQGTWQTKDEIGEIIRKYQNAMDEEYEQAEEYGWDEDCWKQELEYWYDRQKQAPESFETENVDLKISYNRSEAERYLHDDETDRLNNANLIWGGVTLQGKDYNFLLNNNWIPDYRMVCMALVKGEYETGGLWKIYSPDMAESTDAELYDVEEAGENTMSIEEDAEQSAKGADGRKLKTSREEMKLEGDALVRKLGLDGMQVAAYRDCGIYREVLNGYHYAGELIYTRVIEGVPVTYTDYRSVYDEEQQDYSEAFRVAYDDEGLAQIIWKNPTKIYDMSDEYVFLLPFSEILNVFQEEAMLINRSESEADIGEAPQKIIRIRDIRLGYMWVPDTSTEKEGMLIPVWDFMGTQSVFWPGSEEKGIDGEWSSNPSPYQSYLTINAMDGTVVRAPVEMY